VNLTDTGPLVAMLDTDDQHYEACMEASLELDPGPMLTTWPCFAEAMYLLGRNGGYPYQKALLDLYFAEHLLVHDLSPAEMDRIAALMKKYQRLPMDFADASLVAVAETRSLRRVFTTDKDFWTYRLADGSALEPIPARQ
jgi:uncharacterized protein